MEIPQLDPPSYTVLQSTIAALYKQLWPPRRIELHGYGVTALLSSHQTCVEAVVKRQSRCPVLLIAAMLLSPDAAADGYPAKPVKIITQGAAGSGPDVITRIVADHLRRSWGQQVTILNHPGAGGVMAGRAAATAERDGYTLYAPTITTFVILPEIQPTLPFDLERDFARVGLLAETPMMIAVSPALGVRSLPELIALAKKTSWRIVLRSQ